MPFINFNFSIFYIFLGKFLSKVLTSRSLSNKCQSKTTGIYSELTKHELQTK